MKKLAFLSLFILCGCSSKEETLTDVTGTWQTPSKVPYIIEYTPERPEGESITLNGTQFLERKVTIKWKLTQKANGLVTGSNEWVVYSENGTLIDKGTESVVGVVNGNKVALIEGKKTDAPQVHFDCIANGQKKLSCFGFDVGGNRPFAIHFTVNKID